MAIQPPFQRDPQAPVRTREFIDQASRFLNSLIANGTFTMSGPGTWSMNLAIGTTITGGDATSFLYVTSAGKLGDTAANMTYDAGAGQVTIANCIAGQLFIGTLFVSGLLEFVTDNTGATHVSTLAYFGGTTGFLTQWTFYSDATQDALILTPQSGNACLSVLNIPQPPTAAIPFRVTASNTTTNQVWVTTAGELVVQIATATAFCVGRQGQTSPAFQVDASTGTSVTGLLAKAAASGGGYAISVQGGGTNENLTVNAKGSGTITLGSVSTGLIAISRNLTVAGTETITSANAAAQTVGRQGATNPVWQVDASVASVVTGLKLQGQGSGSSVQLVVTSSVTNENLNIDTKGSGTFILNGIGGTGPVQIGGAGSGNNATGLKVTPHTANSGVNLVAVSTGATESLSIDPKGATSVLNLGTNDGTVQISNSASGKTGFFSTSPVAQQTGDIATALANYGLVTSPTVAATSLTGLVKTSNNYRFTDVTTTSSTMADVGNLSFSIAAGEVWSVEFNLLCTGSLGGMDFQLTGPASPSLVAIFTQGDNTGIAVVSSDNQTAFSTPTQAYFVNIVPFTGVATIKALIVNGSNAGTIQLQFASITNTETNKVLKGSYMTARRVA